jgi:hypothetical protein
MEDQRSVADTIRELEEYLLRSDLWNSGPTIDRLLADEFVEFGSSGRVFDKQQIIDALQEDGGPCQRSLRDFSARLLAPAHHVLAGAYIRDGKYEQALWTLDNADGKKLVPESPAVDSWLSQILNDSLRAIALLKFGRVNLGRAALQRVVKSSEQRLRASREQPFGEITAFWWNWYPIQAFRHEAEELLQESDARAKSAQPKK